MIKLIKEDSPKLKVCKPTQEEIEQAEMEFKEALDTYSKEDLINSIIIFLKNLGFRV